MGTCALWPIVARVVEAREPRWKGRPVNTDKESETQSITHSHSTEHYDQVPYLIWWHDPLDMWLIRLQSIRM
jgi:hypothetical protein